jgi:hypothetical protein
MMVYSQKLLMLALSLSLVNCVIGDPITSKEYKVMLKPANFTGSSSTVNTRLSSLRTALANYATSLGRTSTGSFTLKSGMPRQVKFYDTWNCDIYYNGYAFRMRRDSGKTNWEGTLKFRNPSQALADTRRTKMNHCATNNLGGKFEGDISLGGSLVYAYSHDCEISNSKNINILDDVDDTWDEINQVWVDEFFWDLNTDIYKVNDITISEKAYNGFKVNFPGTAADFTATIWYSTSTSTTPLLVELSFTTDADSDPNVDAFWNGMATAPQLTPWLDTNALFKTNWLYTQWGC